MPEYVLYVPLTRLQKDVYEQALARESLRSSEPECKAKRFETVVKRVNNMRLRNLVMQLRKICAHPYLFDWPLDETNQPVSDEQLVNASGKMLLLNRLLDELFH